MPREVNSPNYASAIGLEVWKETKKSVECSSLQPFAEELLLDPIKCYDHKSIIHP